MTLKLRQENLLREGVEYYCRAQNLGGFVSTVCFSNMHLAKAAFSQDLVEDKAVHVEAVQMSDA